MGCANILENDDEKLFGEIEIENKNENKNEKQLQT